MLQYQEPAVELMFSALADPTRRAMVDRLIDGPASVSELAQPLSISLPAVVQQLHVLEDSGLVSSSKVGRVRTCAIRPGALSAAEQWIAQRRRTWEERLDRLGEFLAASPPPGENPTNPTGGEPHE
jgi:DNA-binding transcriptional ArsR family regulator